MRKKLRDIAQEVKSFPVSEKKILFKEKLTENYFSNKSLLGNRHCLFYKNIRLNRKGELQAKFPLLIIDHYTPPIWDHYGWMDFIKYIEFMEKDKDIEYPYIK